MIFQPTQKIQRYHTIESTLRAIFSPRLPRSGGRGAGFSPSLALPQLRFACGRGNTHTATHLFTPSPTKWGKGQGEGG